ncbi:MAG: hypothetical protein ACK2TU_03700 [Anaerolineales bacterium]|jgi:uncharacterized repeat protein (TIGR04076 family)
MTDYEIELEIFEGEGGELKAEGPHPNYVEEGICAWMYDGNGVRSYKVGDKFQYPEELGEICPWLLDSLTGIIRALEHGGTLTWRYKDTPYEKQIDPEGVTTEYVRCIDPTSSGIVMKVTRKAIKE